jgi:hypothetical protein
MRFLIAGAGAIGGYMGALRWRAPALDVTLFARGPHLRAIEERGLRRPRRRWRFPRAPKVTGDLAGLIKAGPADVIVPGRVKAHSLTQLAPRLLPLIGEEHHRGEHAKRRPVVVLPGGREPVSGAALRARRSRRHRSAPPSIRRGWSAPSSIRRPDRGARRHPPHRRQPHLAGRAGRQPFAPLPRHRRGAHPGRTALSRDHPHPPRNLGQAVWATWRSTPSAR